MYKARNRKLRNNFLQIDFSYENIVDIIYVLKYLVFELNDGHLMH